MKPAFLLFFALAFSAGLSSAGILRVEATSEASAPDGSQWSLAFPYLQDALAAAVSGDEIWIAEGTYYPDEGTGITDNDREVSFNLIEGVSLYGGFAGTELVRTARDADAHPTILSGDLLQNPDDTGHRADNSYHVVFADSTITEATHLDGLTITLGYADGDSSNNQHRGGGMYCDSASPTLTHCIFIDNQASNNSGALHLTGSNSVITSCRFESNVSNLLNGGAITISSSSQPEWIDCDFIANRVVGNSRTGGAIRNNSAYPIRFTRCRFLANVCGNTGGAVYNIDTSAIFSDCLFSGNYADVRGGAIANVNSTITLINCTLAANRAGIEAGGITSEDGQLSLLNSLIWNNRDETGTGTRQSSIDPVTNTEYNHCLIQGYNPSGTGNLNGNLSSNSPQFANPINPGAAPNRAGDFRLLYPSTAIDAGDSELNSESLDLAGNPRQAATIDIGAYEHAATLFVDAAATGNADGQSWGNAYPTLREALASSGFDQQIWIAEGTYAPADGATELASDRTTSFAIAQRTSLYGGFPSGGGDGSMSARSPATWPTILSGDLTHDDSLGNVTNNAVHVVKIDDGDDDSFSDVLLDGLTVTAGFASLNDGSENFQAGGIDNRENLTLQNLIISGNFALGHSGGIALRMGDCHIENSIIRDNEANGSAGGGGMLVAGPVSLVMTDSSFSNNLIDNSQTFSGGGGMVIESGAQVTLERCAFQGNQCDSPGRGGGLKIESDDVTIENCLFSGNQAEQGAGIYLEEITATLINCTISGNRALFSGGGVGASTLAGAEFYNCIIWNNSAGGIVDSASATLEMDSSLGTFSHSLLAQWNPTGSGNLDGTDAQLDLRFVDPISPTSTPSTAGDFRLLTGSPALDAGDDAANDSSLDLAGKPRVQNSVIDLGAYEGPSGVTFATLYPELDPAADANGNGISNFGDYALGADPTAAADPTLSPLLEGQLLQVTYRNDATDVLPTLQKSENLNDWSPMVEGIDYLANPATTKDATQTQLQLDLITDPSVVPRLFYRLSFPESAN
ncbi:hypothetical protein JIN85_15355 [Luteolibacter pohnpeiensis]|uniref:Right handed beta helix domain-containing protein n=1 Tax=Luteolibacter pohnpeiensis TaxID=454153 RepID=A0A934SDC0_9BACT|nr:right-handed parallel beta-helix repeat-containing protein [Luteolibacter pohnpeiensis]MBK1883794.1 hypothetical protein [Luteolibacter pohnpeiensis]